MWHSLGETTLLSISKWPEFDETKTVDDTVTIAVQICGKTRATINVPNGADEDTVKAAALSDARVKQFTDGKTIVKQIYVKNKIFNIVVK